MQQDKLKNKNLAILFWILSGICFLIIFYFSSRTANDSAEQSSVILDFLIKIFGTGALSDFIIRKSAHFLEYVGTCLLINWAWLFTKGKKQMLISIICTSAYAITDEVHQMFVDGRSCELRDWAIDTSGAIVGAITFFVIYQIVNAILKKKNNI